MITTETPIANRSIIGTAPCESRIIEIVDNDHSYMVYIRDGSTGEQLDSYRLCGRTGQILYYVQKYTGICPMDLANTLLDLLGWKIRPVKITNDKWSPGVVNIQF